MSYITEMFPTEWTTDVLILRDDGRNKYGSNKSEVPHHKERSCLVGPATTKDLQDFIDAPREYVTLSGAPNMDIKPTDRIMVPRGHGMTGIYRVNGRVAFWPLGTSVPLSWVRDLTDDDQEVFDAH